MSLTKKVEIDRKVYSVNELTMQQIVDLTNGEADSALSPLIKMLECCTDAKKEDILPMSPSDIGTLVDALVEVNTPFLQQARKIGAPASAEALETLLRSVCLIAFLP